MQYEKLYAEMVDATEQAIEAIEHGNYGQAKEILISPSSAAKRSIWISVFHFSSVIMNKGDRYKLVGRLRIFFSSHANKFDRQ